MKSALLLYSLLFSTAAVPQNRHRTITWTDIHDYITNQSSSVSRTVEAELYAESITSSKTWLVSASNGVRRDGGGVGWPSRSSMVNFSTLSAADTLASMIDEFRLAQSALKR